MKENDILKKAVELYEKDRGKGERQEREALTELNIPEQYYTQAKALLHKRKKDIKSFITIGVILLGTLFYFLGRNIFISMPQLRDLSVNYEGRNLKVKFKLISESTEDFEIKGILYDPDDKIFDVKKQTTSFKFESGKNYLLSYSFNSLPQGGAWKLKLSVKLAKGGLWEKELGLKELVLP